MSAEQRDAVRTSIFCAALWISGASYAAWADDWPEVLLMTTLAVCAGAHAAWSLARVERPT